MIKLYQFAPTWGLPNASPFCLKLETYLRMAKLPFEVVSNADIRNAPKGKMPYIEDRGQVIGDSSLIIDYLKATYGDALDRHLSAYEQGIALAMQRLMEEDLYWCMLYARWHEPAGWEKTRPAYFGTLPPLLRDIVARTIRKQVVKSLHLQGMGRHSAEEVYTLGKADLNALANYLSNKPFFMGDRPTTLDATAYGFLTNILYAPIESPLKTYTEELPQLTTYCERMKELFYSGITR